MTGFGFGAPARQGFMTSGRDVGVVRVVVTALVAALLVPLAAIGSERAAGAAELPPNLPVGVFREVPFTIETVQGQRVHPTRGPECVSATFVVFDGDTYGMNPADGQVTIWWQAPATDSVQYNGALRSPLATTQGFSHDAATFALFPELTPSFAPRYGHPIGSHFVDTPDGETCTAADLAATQARHEGFAANAVLWSEADPNRDPVASFTWAPSPTEPRTVVFTNTSTDIDGDPLQSSWSFGPEGATSTETSPTHQFPEGTSFEVTLTVNDGQGGTDSDTQTVSLLGLVVNSTGDSHALDPEVGCDTGNTVGEAAECTLRAAIQTANADGGGTISFAIAGSGVPSIAPGAALPEVGPGTTIDGTTQEGGFVRIDGGESITRGLVLAGGTSEVTGMVIDRFDAGVYVLSGTGHVIEGNRIGTNATGDGPGQLSFGVGGVNATDVAVRDNTFSCLTCIHLIRMDGAVVSGNSFDVSVAGDGFGSSRVGILIDDGSAEVTDNVVNTQEVGILVTRAGASGTAVRGNFVGSSRAGEAFDGPDDGIRIDGAPSVTVSGNVVTARGHGSILVTGSRQITSGNVPLGPDDEVLEGPVTGGSAVVTDNVIGVLEGSASSPARSTDGVAVWAGASQVTIRGNVIANQRRSGVLVRGGAGHQIHDNTIGTNPSGTAAQFPQPFGVRLEGGTDARVGISGQGNTIRVTDQGVLVAGGATGAQIVGNTVRDAAVGIGSPSAEGDDDAAPVTGLVVQSNTVEASGIGVNLTSVMQGTVVRSNLTRGGDVAGVLVAASATGTVVDANTVLGAPRGILNQGADSTITANRVGIDSSGTVDGSSLAGIALDASATVRDNVVVGSGEIGIGVGAGAVGDLRGNEIYETDGTPIDTETGPPTPTISAAIRTSSGEADRTILVVTGIPAGEAGVVEVFSNDDCSDPEARHALQIDHPTSGGRTWAVVPVLGRGDRDAFTVTFRTPTDGTSALSNCEARSTPSDGDGDGSPDPIEELLGIEGDPTQAVLVTEDGDLLLVDTADGQLRDVRLLDAPAPDGGPTLPHGLVGFTVEGLEPAAATTVHVGIVDGPGTGGDAYWKYGPPSEGSSPTWYRFDPDEESGTGAETDVVDYGGAIGLRRMWSLSLVDGGRGDHDGIANGRIVDPGGPGTGGPPVVSPELACFIDAAHRTFLDRPATESEIAISTAALETGTPRSDLPRILATSDEWLSVQVTRLYAAILDRTPEPTGTEYWVGRLQGGASVSRVAALIYASGEHYANAGGTDAAFVTGLYQRILDRTPEPGGLEYWTGRIARSGRALVAGLIFGSPESLGARVDALYADVLGRPAEPAGRQFWIGRLAQVDDVRVAIELASSTEYLDRSVRSCTLLD